MDNPKPTAELSMLKQYGPDVPDATLRKLVAVFGELRSMADQGTITYPYSVREVVSIVKHLQVRTHVQQLFSRTLCMSLLSLFINIFVRFLYFSFLLLLFNITISCCCFQQHRFSKGH